MADSRKDGKSKTGSAKSGAKEARSRTIELTATDVTPPESDKAEKPKEKSEPVKMAEKEQKSSETVKEPNTSGESPTPKGRDVMAYALSGLFGGVAALMGAAVLVSFQMIDLSGNAGQRAQQGIGALDKRLSSALDQAHDQGTKRDAAIAALKESVGKAGSRSSVHEDMIGKSAAALNDMKASLKTVSGQVNIVSDKLNRLTASLASAEKRLESLNGAIGGLGARLKSESEARADLGPRIAANAALLEKRGSDIGKLMKWQDAMSIESRKLGGQMSNLLAGLKDIERSVAEASTAGGGAPSSAGVRLALLDKKIIRLEKDLTGLSTTLQSLPAVPPDLSPQISILEKTVARFDKNFAEAGSKRAGLQDAVRKLDERIRDLGLMAERMEAINSRIDEVKARYSEFGQSMNVLRSASRALGLGEDGTSEALKGLNHKLESFRSDLAGKIATLEKTTAGIKDAEAKLAGVDVRLESVKAAQTELAAMQMKSAREQAAARLSRDLLSGGAYSEALAGFLSLASSIQVPERVKAFAPKGIPSLAMLQDEFAPIREAVDAASVMKPDDGLMGRLMKSAGSVVSIRRTGPASGSGPSAIASRVADYLGKGKLDLAIQEAGSLKGDVADKVNIWIENARARLDAEKFAVDVRALALAAAERG